MINLQVKRFDDHSENAIDEINEFIKDKEVIDIKQNISSFNMGGFYSQYLVIYKTEVSE